MIGILHQSSAQRPPDRQASNPGGDRRLQRVSSWWWEGTEGVPTASSVSRMVSHIAVHCDQVKVCGRILVRPSWLSAADTQVLN